MRFIGKGGRAGFLLPGALMVAAVVLGAPGAVRAQPAGTLGAGKPPPDIVLSNCKVAPLVAAIQKANKTATGDTIVLKAGCTYTLTAGPYDNGGGPNGLPVVTAPLTIHGNGATISRSPRAPAFRFFLNENELRLDHLTLSNGSTPTDATDPPLGSGGAILSGAPLTIANSTFVGNTASVEGGAIRSFAPLSLTRVTFEGNSVTLPAQGNRAVGGGAVSAGWNAGAPLVVVDSTFTGNQTNSNYGGAIAYSGGQGDVSITRSTFTSNQGGGAFWIGGADSVTVRDSTFTLNEGGGGAIQWEGGGPNDHGTLTVTGSTFDRNPGVAGGLAVDAGGSALPGPDVLVVVANSTFFDSAINFFWTGAYDPAMHVTNSTLYGSDLSAGGNASGTGSLTLRNSIVTGAVICGPNVLDGGGNLSWLSDGRCPGIRGDPRLRMLTWNGGPTQTMATDPGSAAIGNADGTIATAPLGDPLFGAGGVDQRGVIRMLPFDIGAYER